MMHYRQKKGFTIIEIVVATVIIGVGLVSIIGVLQYSTRLTATTRAQVIAINLAREGVEMMYNKRDTNRQMYQGKKNQCWLVNESDPNNNNCENVERFVSPGIVTPDPKPLMAIRPSTANTGIQTLSKLAIYNTLPQDFYNAGFNPQTVGEFFDTAKICYNQGGMDQSLTIVSAKYGKETADGGGAGAWTDVTSIVSNYFFTKTIFQVENEIFGDPLGGTVKDLVIIYQIGGGSQQTVTYSEHASVDPNVIIAQAGGICGKQYGEFWRYIKLEGLYDKTDGSEMTCTNGSGVCGDDRAKELRFCSIVDYVFDQPRRVQLCSVMTNFLE